MKSPPPLGSSLLRSALILAFQILPAIFLLLFGWGWDDLPAFFQNPARAGLITITLAAAAASFFLGLDLHPLRKGLRADNAASETRQLAILLLLSLFVLWFLPFADRRQILTFRGNSWRMVGLALCCIGAGVRLLALRALGQHFSAYVTLQPHHRLVREGLYRFVRHPLYLSLLLAPAGIALVFRSFLVIPIQILAALFVLDRIRQEEALLAAHFGSEFESYRRSSRKLLPLLL